jgi:sulfate-transporting ATPase
VLTKGFKAGMVPQEPKLPDRRDGARGARLGVRRHDGADEGVRGHHREDGRADGDDEMDKAIERMGVLQDKLDAADAWNLDTRLKEASEALCLPDDDRIVDTLSGGEKRRVALCKALLERPTSCCWTSRRTISTPRRSTGWKSSCANIRAR